MPVFIWSHRVLVNLRFLDRLQRRELGSAAGPATYKTELSCSTAFIAELMSFSVVNAPGLSRMLPP